MFSSTRQSPHRRRSHSAAPPLSLTTRRPALDDKWRAAAKRPRPSTLRTPSYKDLALDPGPQKWDVDRWRKGKRARRDSAVSPSVRFARPSEADPQFCAPKQSPAPTARGPCLFGSSSVFRDELGPAPTPAHALPSTSAAFDFFPARPQHPQNPPHHDCTAPFAESSTSASADVDQLRSQAFCELQRSIADSGAGFLSRMRALEESRTRPLDERPRHERRFDGAAQLYADEDDDVQIQIVSGPPCAPPASAPAATTTRKARAFSLNDMDMDTDMDVDELTSPDDGPSRCSSPCGLEDEDEAPTLSYTRTNSTNSSFVSLPSYAQSHPYPQDAAQYPLGCASPSEKAVAALTLVMANGAGGLNDYAAVRAVDMEGVPLDEAHVGAMWD